MSVYSKSTPLRSEPDAFVIPEVSELVQTKTDLSEVIAENFGANATYVEGC